MKTLCVSQKALAGWLDLGARRVRELTTMKVLVQTPTGYDLKANVHRYLAFIRSKTGTVSDERTRLLKAQADMQELKVRLRTGEVVSREAVSHATFAVIRAARDKLFNIPDRTSGILAAETDQAKIHATLTREIHETLTEMSHGFGHTDY